ncbi:MAG: hypothetical protein IJ496_05485, partial [Ruminococcus sp.]|nr:hypothetical protein [Ruminococcus sp.]
VALLLTAKGDCQLSTTKQPAQIAQTASGHIADYFCFLHCLLDRGRGKAALRSLFILKKIPPNCTAGWNLL